MKYICPRGAHIPERQSGSVYCTVCDEEMYLNPSYEIGFGAPPLDWVPRITLKEWP